MGTAHCYLWVVSHIHGDHFLQALGGWMRTTGVSGTTPGVTLFGSSVGVGVTVPSTGSGAGEVGRFVVHSVEEIFSSSYELSSAGRGGRLRCKALWTM